MLIFRAVVGWIAVTAMPLMPTPMACPGPALAGRARITSANVALSKSTKNLSLLFRVGQVSGSGQRIADLAASDTAAFHGLVVPVRVSAEARRLRPSSNAESFLENIGLSACLCSSAHRLIGGAWEYLRMSCTVRKDDAKRQRGHRPESGNYINGFPKHIKRKRK